MFGCDNVCLGYIHTYKKIAFSEKVLNDVMKKIIRFCHFATFGRSGIYAYAGLYIVLYPNTLPFSTIQSKVIK